MTTKLKSASYFIPGHVTGLFIICPHDDVLKFGSIGYGINLSTGTKSNIHYNPQSKNNPEVYYNKQRIDGGVSLTALRLLFEKVKRKIPLGIKIFHHSHLPIQSGYSTSSAGALGTVFSVNDCFELNIDAVNLSQLAHIAEVKNKTGLGGVIAQVHGKGMEVRKQPGAPNIGVIERIPCDLKVLTANNGRMKTSSILSDPIARQKINKAGREIYERNQDHMITPLVLMRSSREFAERSQLISPSIRRVLDHCDQLNLGMPATMAMLGESIFVLGDFNTLNDLVSEIKKVWPDSLIQLHSIETKGVSICSDEETNA